MFKFNYTINKVDIYSADNNHIMYCLQNGSIYLDEIKIHENSSEKVFGAILNNDFYKYGSVEEQFLKNFKNEITIPSPKGSSPNTLSKAGIVVTKNSIHDKQLNVFIKDFYYLNFETNKEHLLFKEKHGVFLLNHTDHQSIFRSSNKLSLYNLFTGECYWEIDLDGRIYFDNNEKKQVTIVRLIGIEAGQLIVFMSNKELLSITIETGKILWETKDFIKNNLPPYKDYRMAVSIFYYGILENGKLYQLHGNIYYSINLVTQEVEILWEDTAEKDYLTCKYASYTEDYVYFTGSKNNAFSPYLIGAFNRKTLQVDWIHHPEDLVNPLTNVPHYVNGKLYILDSGRMLHVYEKAF